MWSAPHPSEARAGHGHGGDATTDVGRPFVIRALTERRAIFRARGVELEVVVAGGARPCEGLGQERQVHGSSSLAMRPGTSGPKLSFNRSATRCSVPGVRRSRISPSAAVGSHPEAPGATAFRRSVPHAVQVLLDVDAVADRDEQQDHDHERRSSSGWMFMRCSTPCVLGRVVHRDERRHDDDPAEEHRHQRAHRADRLVVLEPLRSSSFTL